MEEFVQGYCREIDAARTVLVEDGEASCDFPTCPYMDSCDIAKQVQRILNVQDPK